MDSKMNFVAEMAPHLAANLLAVLFVICAIGIYRSESSEKKSAEYPYYWGGAVFVLLTLLASVYSYGAFPSGI